MIKFKVKGDFSNLTNFLEQSKEKIKLGNLDKYGRQGVDALASATPKDTGKTSESWSYDIIRSNNIVTIVFNNSNFNDGVPIAVVLQYGHVTRNGGYVEGIDYINPAIKPIFKKIIDDAWDEVRK